MGANRLDDPGDLLNGKIALLGGRAIRSRRCGNGFDEGDFFQRVTELTCLDQFAGLNEQSLFGGELVLLFKQNLARLPTRRRHPDATVGWARGAGPDQ